MSLITTKPSTTIIKTKNIKGIIDDLTSCFDVVELCFLNFMMQYTIRDKVIPKIIVAKMG